MPLQLTSGATAGELTRGFSRVALDELVVETMNEHTARAFQWFGRKPLDV